MTEKEFKESEEMINELKSIRSSINSSLKKHYRKLIIEIINECGKEITISEDSSKYKSIDLDLCGCGMTCFGEPFEKISLIVNLSFEDLLFFNIYNGRGEYELQWLPMETLINVYEFVRSYRKLHKK